MTKPDYRAPVAAGGKAVFAEWAARLAVGLPMLAVVSLYGVRYLQASNQINETYFKWYLWGVVAVLGAAVVLGIVALTGIKKHGPEGILLPSCVGIGLSLLFAGYLVYSGSFSNPVERLTHLVTGDWQIKGQVANGPAVEQRLSLRPNRNATVTLMVGQQSISEKGQWKVMWDGSAKSAALVITWDPGSDPQLGKGAMWAITEVDKDRLTLDTPNGNSLRRDNYERVGK